MYVELDGGSLGACPACGPMENHHPHSKALLLLPLCIRIEHRQVLHLTAT